MTRLIDMDEQEAVVRKLFQDGLRPRTIARVYQLAELTGEEPEAIVARYKQIEASVKHTVYGA